MLRPRVVRALVIGTLTVLGFIFYLHLAASVLATDDIDSNDSSIQQDGVLKNDRISLEQAESDNAERLQRVQQICHKYNLGLYKHSASPPIVAHPPTPQYSVFYFDKSNHLAYCPIFKSGSSTMLYNLLLLGGYTDEMIGSAKQQLSVMARKVYPELEDEGEAEMEFQTSLKLLVVRHPFARLLSAYRDKLENVRMGIEHGTEHFYRKYGRIIVKKYRHRFYDSNETMAILKPDQYVLDPRLPKPVGNEPTFKEFVNYLVDVDLIHYADDHWIPYYLYCTPCLLNYDIIAQVESLNRDQLYFIKSSGLEGQIKPRWTHKTAKYQTSEIAKRYFSQLSKDEVKKLYERYRLDFELFGYEIDDYLKLAS